MNPHQQAFPGPRTDRQNSGGMTMREWYAGLAMQGYLAHQGAFIPANVARIAFAVADAMIAKADLRDPGGKFETGPGPGGQNP